MKTAVEWLVNELRNGKEFNDEIIEKAKEMEKAQIVEAYRIGVEEEVYLNPLGTGEEYYNKTFK